MPNNEFQQPTDFLDIAGEALNTGADIRFRPKFQHIVGHKSINNKLGSEVNLKDYMVNSLTNASTEDDILLI